MRYCRNCNRAKRGGFKEKCFAFFAGGRLPPLRGSLRLSVRGRAAIIFRTLCNKPLAVGCWLLAFGMRLRRDCNRAKRGEIKGNACAFRRAADCRPYGNIGKSTRKPTDLYVKLIFRCAKSKIIFIKSLNNKIQFPLRFVLAAACLRSPIFAQRIQRLSNLCPTAKNRQNPSKVCRFSFFIRSN